MTESNKILTVSYGTFSCTLEGFDDPFGTMRGIAEYFRDLAAEDRYFGAEPPTPDVEMLQNIAQRDVQRRVEARIGESGVSLRASDSIEDAELSETAPEPTGAPTKVEDTAEAEDQVVTAAGGADDVETPPLSVDEAGADETGAEESSVDEAPVEVDIEEDSGPLAFDDEYLMADEPEDAFTIDANVEVEDKPAPESIAEKLRRIRAVVSRNIEPEQSGTAGFGEAADPEVSAFDAPAPKRERALSETIRSITADISDEDDADALEPKAAPEEAEIEAEDDISLFADDTDEDDAALYEEAPEAVEASEAPFIEDEAEDEVDEEADDETLADLIAAVSQEEDTADHEVDDADSDDEDIAEGTDDLSDHDDLTGEATEDEVLDTLSEDFELDADALIDVEDDEDEDNDLNDEAPAAIVAEDASDEREKSAQLEPLSETNGNVGRLLKETDEKFADDEGIRRRRVISQMRAAVAATKAERVLSKPMSAAEQARQDQSPYRRDLNQAMPADNALTPAEPQESEDLHDGDEPQAPVVEAEAPKAAPLVLVSSQRVDEAPARVAKPVKPQKRVVSESGSFAAFAEEMGAEELPDLLEAAAAFSAFVEGQPHFSRPEIMKRVARIDPALSLSREVGLRSFGMLLRQGKIHKLQRGQFKIAEDTRFNPAHRIAGE